LAADVNMGFNLNKFKVQLKLAINRSKLLQAKKTSLQQHARKEIADLLAAGKIESARIRVRRKNRNRY
jgi:vacuolar protein sorting-associated protein IST1